MEPIRTIRWGLQFASQLSPAWLIPVLPAVAVLAWYLYRRQSHDVAPVHAIGLTVLRCAMVVFIAFLAFRPNLTRQETLKYPGRTVVLQDDSESMGVPDPDMDVFEALRIARMESAGETEDPLQLGHRLAASVLEAKSGLERFRRFSRDADRSLDSFWNRSEVFEKEMEERFEALSEGLSSIADAAPYATEDTVGATEIVKALQAELLVITAGNRHPGSQAFDAYSQQLEDLRQSLLAIQARVDQHILEQDDERANRLAAQAESVATMPRIRLLGRATEAIRGAHAEERETQFLQFQPLVSGERSLTPAELETAPGASDIVSELTALVEEDSEFPLSGILLLSDGRDTEGGDLQALTKAASRSKVPINCVAIGEETEPPDLAVLDVIAPPVAVKGRKLDVRVRVKTSVPEGAPETAPVRVTDSNGAVIGESTVPLGDAEVVELAFSLTPGEVGLERYRVVVGTIDGEVVAKRNNQAQFVVRVRQGPLNVLFLDVKPRWETRFVLNVLRRLDYVQLNPIVLLTNKEKEILRGAERGQWPSELSALQMYDLVFLGNLAPDTLAEDDWKMLRRFVEDKGGTLCFLNGIGGEPTREVARRHGLYPLSEAATADASVDTRLSAQFRLTEAGQFHPVTRGLARALLGGGNCTAEQLEPDSVALLTGIADQRATAACRLVGAGQAFALDTALLWKRLNPTSLGVHERLYLEVVSWAADSGAAVQAAQNAEGATATEEAMAPPAVRPGGRSLQQEMGKLVLANASRRGDSVQAVNVDGEVVGEAEYAPLEASNALSGARLPPLPPGEYRLQEGDRDVLPGFRFVVNSREKELRILARNTRLLDRLSEGTGGRIVPLHEAATAISQLTPKTRIEEHRKLFRLWDAVPVLIVLIVLLAVEWVWRKLAGLI